MSKIIINNLSNVTDACVLIRVADVLQMGRISDNGTSYCGATTYRDAVTGVGVVVCAKRNKESDTIYDCGQIETSTHYQVMV